MQPDFYIALGYFPLVQQNSRGYWGNNVLLCAAAGARARSIHQIHHSSWGNVQSDYFFSHLISTPSAAGYVRRNIGGPYRQHEIADPARTILAGNAVAYDDVEGIYGTDWGMAAEVGYYNLGDNYTCFGVVSWWSANYADPQPTYHPTGPKALFWNGHVESIKAPPASNRFALRPRFTADGKPGSNNVYPYP